jgi:hypothetical protein
MRERRREKKTERVQTLTLFIDLSPLCPAPFFFLLLFL